MSEREEAPERVKQIRERYENGCDAINQQREPDCNLSTYLSDIDFLLSLLDSQASRASVAAVEGDAFTEDPPSKQGWYWHWNGDKNCAPVPISVLIHGAGDRKCFVSMGQLGLTQAIECDEYGGWWMPLIPPSTTAGRGANTGLHCNGCGVLIMGWPNVYRCVTSGCGRIYHYQCLLEHCASDHLCQNCKRSYKPYVLRCDKCGAEAFDCCLSKPCAKCGSVITAVSSSLPAEPLTFEAHVESCSHCAEAVGRFPNLALFDHQLCGDGMLLFRSTVDPATAVPTEQPQQYGISDSEQRVKLLLRYVDHLRGCASYTNGACSCGFESAMREPAEPLQPTGEQEPK